LILISFVINKNNNDNNCNNIKENDDNFCLNRLKEIINKDLKLKLNAQDMNENSILLLISNNFKEINNYYKMIIDNLYSYYYLINDDSNINKSINKFPNCLSLNINSLNNIQKSNIISLFFFDSYKLSNNYNIEDLNNFFEIFLYKSKENESLIIYNNSMSLNDNNNEYDNERYNNTISNYYTYCPNNQIKYNENNYILGKTINNNKNNIFMDDYYLPPIQSYYKYTLVLDLDETLVYYQKDPNYLNNIYNINNIKNTLILRPGLLDFLHKMKPLYELVLFSFGTKEYVDTILSVIEKKEKIFEYVLYRQHATYEKGDYVKNLELLGRDLKKVIIVDDIPRAFKLQKNNGICIKAFYGDTISDRNTLKLLGMILEKIRFDAEENDGDIRNSLQKQRNLIFTHITTNLDC
jgi:Dullard-like phosphatase family protein